MKKIVLSFIITFFVCSISFAETWIEDYGYYENKNEISAKKDIIGSIAPENIFDFNTSSNPGGEAIKDGKYYVPIMYNGGYNGVDTDYIYADELNGKDGTNGQDGKKGDKGDTGKDGKKGDKGEQGIKGEDGKGLKNSTELQYEGVIKSWKRAEVSIYYIHDFNNDRDTVGAKVKHYWGKSWSEKELEKVNERLDRLENTKVNYVERDNVEVKHNTKSGFTIEKKIAF